MGGEEVGPASKDNSSEAEIGMGSREGSHHF